MAKKINYNKVDKLYAEGFTATQISKKMGVSYPAIYKYLKDKKVEVPEVKEEKKNEKKQEVNSPANVDSDKDDDALDRNPNGTFKPGICYNNGPKNTFKKAMLKAMEEGNFLETICNQIKEDAAKGEYKAIDFLGRYFMSPLKPLTYINVPKLKSNTPAEINDSFGILIDQITEGKLDIDSGLELAKMLEMRRAFIATVTFEEDLKNTQRQIAEAQEKRKVEDQERLRQLQQLQELTRAQQVKQTLTGKK